jgi:DNA-binding transcriptional MerR regulator
MHLYSLSPDHNNVLKPAAGLFYNANMSEAFLSISETSKRLDVPAHTLRYWEKQFPAAVRPATGAGGRRYYRPETLEALGRIRTLLYDRGMTIAGVRKLLKDGIMEESEAGAAAATFADNAQDVRGGGRAGLGDFASRTGLLARAAELLELAKAELEADSAAIRNDS